MRWALFAMIVAVAPLAGGCRAELGPAPAQQMLPIVNGTLDRGHPAVGMLIRYEGEDSYTCTGTLIGSRTVLTAAHCVDHNPSSVTFTVGGGE